MVGFGAGLRCCGHPGVQPRITHTATTGWAVAPLPPKGISVNHATEAFPLNVIDPHDSALSASHTSRSTSSGSHSVRNQPDRT